ncbi:unnamed protein product [Allacma fusca]|uniref:Uncharacterized protein n=1 Tax=Allacma fusca TaxID=39272 RepID=A0A8J2JY25_9HEXA|nr:unnamed protein product [Allacma fusca]
MISSFICSAARLTEICKASSAPIGGCGVNFIDAMKDLEKLERSVTTHIPHASIPRWRTLGEPKNVPGVFNFSYTVAASGGNEFGWKAQKYSGGEEPFY